MSESDEYSRATERNSRGEKRTRYESSNRRWERSVHKRRTNIFMTFINKTGQRSET